MSGAFTFIEVLFSVIIIGVGFIMVAAMFPIAIEQSQTNLSESVAVSVGRDAIRDIQSAVSGNPTAAPSGTPNLLMLPPTFDPVTNTPLAGLYPVMPLPNVQTFVGRPAPGFYAAQSLILQPASSPQIVSIPTLPAAYASILANPAILSATANQVYAADRRFGWVGFYRRDLTRVNVGGTLVAVPAPYAQIWVITAQSTVEGQITFPPAFTCPSTANSIVIPGTTASHPTYFIGCPNPLVTTGNICAATLVHNSLSSGTTVPQGSSIYIATKAATLPGQMAGTGAFALIMSAADTNLIGQVVRLGSVIPNNNLYPTYANGTIWSLQPGYDLNANDANLASPGQNVVVFILGSPLVVQGTTASFTGPIQDISCTSGFVRCND